MQLVPFITKVLSSNPINDEVYSIQHYVIKFVSDLQHVGGFLLVLWFLLTIKLTTTNIAEILLKLALSAIILTLTLPRFTIIDSSHNSFKIDIYTRSTVTWIKGHTKFNKMLSCKL